MITLFFEATEESSVIDRSVFLSTIYLVWYENGRNGLFGFMRNGHLPFQYHGSSCESKILE